MEIKTSPIICRNEELLLTNERAIFWPREATLILSDLHVGKAAHFRKSGIPILNEILHTDLSRLDNLITFFTPKKLIFVGDLFHAAANSEFSQFQNWVQSNADLDFVLVKGNHDRITQLIRNLFPKLSVVDRLSITPFSFKHEPCKDPLGLFHISGHIHPGVILKGKGKQAIKLPCYQVFEDHMVLPAFSLFTGLNTRKPNQDCISYAFTKEQIYKVD